MTGIERREVTPKETIWELENSLHLYRENKYAFQVGLKDLDFDIDEERLKALDMTLPFKSIDEAEQALRSKAIRPTQFIEHDETEHQVLAFDSRPVGYSGFMDCVTHSLALTNHGLFEVGRYPAMNLSLKRRYWQWFLHRRLATSEQAKDWRERQSMTTEQFVESAYQALVGV